MPDSTPSSDASTPDSGKPRAIPRVVSLIALLAVLVLTAALFFQVMALFVVPLFLAGVLVVVFEPLYKWFLLRLPRKRSAPALATTAVILLAVLAPCVGLGWRAYAEVKPLFVAVANETGAEAAGQGMFARLWNYDFDALARQPAQAGAPGDGEPAPPEPTAGQLRLSQVADMYERVAGKPLTNEEFGRLKGQLISAVGEEGPHSLLVGLQAVGSIGLGLLVMTVAVYYFFVDGPSMIKTMMHLSPLDDAYEEELLERFAQVSRAVVVATVLSAVVQGLLAGIGYYFAVDEGPIFLLTLLTMVMAMVPFVGAMAVWGFVVLTLFIQGDTFAAIGLAIYGAAIVSTVDNIIKPLVLHGQSKLHPLLALLSVLGGVTALGPIGILVGPMLVAFLQALLTMLRKELESFEREGGFGRLAEEAAESLPADSGGDPPAPGS